MASPRPSSLGKGHLEETGKPWRLSPGMGLVQPSLPCTFGQTSQPCWPIFLRGPLQSQHLLKRRTPAHCNSLFPGRTILTPSLLKSRERCLESEKSSVLWRVSIWAAITQTHKHPGFVYCCISSPIKKDVLCSFITDALGGESGNTTQ